MIIGTTTDTKIINDVNQLGELFKPYNVDLYGFKTTSEALPTTGKATYKGYGFGSNNQYDFVYSVDFSRKVGSGDLLKMNSYGGRVQLEESSLDKQAIKGQNLIGFGGKAKALDGTIGTYQVGLFGPSAQEINGILNFPSSSNFFTNNEGKIEIGLSGTRGDITK